MTDDRDALPPDATSGIFRYEYADVDEALSCAKRVEPETELCFQVGDVFYESPVLDGIR